MARVEVIVAGGGFGGLYAARRLERRLRRHRARITLVNDVNFMLYTPLLPGAAAGTLDPRHVVVPLREELRGAELRLGTVAGADPQAMTLALSVQDGERVELRYDHLIVALGSTSRTLPVPGLAQHALGFKTLPEAIELRNRVLRSLEVAETIDDRERREPYLNFVFVGAGYAGLEGLAELQDFAADVIDMYPRCREQGMRWLLVESRDRVMSEIKPALAAFAAGRLRARGIEIRTSTTIEEVGAAHVVLAGGERVPTRTVVWTAGVRPHPVIGRLGLPLDGNGRIRVDREMRVHGVEGVWAIGDCAAVPDPARGFRSASPPTGQHAIRQGRRVGDNVAAVIGGGQPKPFTYRTLGVFVDMGQREAVAETLWIRWRGLPAWLLARTYHLAMMPGLKRKLRLLIDWNVQLAFGRDSAELGGLGHPPALGDPGAAPKISGDPDA